MTMMMKCCKQKAIKEPERTILEILQASATVVISFVVMSASCMLGIVFGILTTDQ